MFGETLSLAFAESWFRSEQHDVKNHRRRPLEWRPGPRRSAGHRSVADRCALIGAWPIGWRSIIRGRSGGGRLVHGRSVGGRLVGGRSVGGRSVRGRSVRGRSVGGHQSVAVQKVRSTAGGRSVRGRSVRGRLVAVDQSMVDRLRPVGARSIGWWPISPWPVGPRSIGWWPISARLIACGRSVRGRLVAVDRMVDPCVADQSVADRWRSIRAGRSALGDRCAADRRGRSVRGQSVAVDHSWPISPWLISPWPIGWR